LKNKHEIIFKEKEELSLCFEKTKDEFYAHKRIYKGKNPKISFDKNEFESLKNKINDLDSNLKICFSNIKKKLDSLFLKGKTQEK